VAPGRVPPACGSCDQRRSRLTIREQAWWQPLTEQQRWDLVVYIRTLHQKQPAGAPSRGAVLYDSYCWTCHGKTGKGDGPIAVAYKLRPHDLTDRAYLSKRTDRDLYNVMRYGRQGDTKRESGRCSGGCSILLSLPHFLRA